VLSGPAPSCEQIKTVATAIGCSAAAALGPALALGAAALVAFL
jgi:hypothetical protein